MQKLLTAGSRWLHGDRIVEIDGPLSLSVVQVRDVGTGTLMPAGIETLQPVARSRLKTELEVVPQAAWDKARALATAFLPYLDAGLPIDEARQFSLQFGVSVRQIRRRMARFRRTPQTSALLTCHGGRPKGSRRLNPEVERLIQHVITKHFACREPVSQLRSAIEFV